MQTNYSNQNERESRIVRTEDIEKYIPSKQENELMFTIKMSIEKALKKYHNNVGFSFERQKNMIHVYLLMRNKPVKLYGKINNIPIKATIKVINGILFSITFKKKPDFLPNEIFFGTIKERKSKMVSNIKHGKIIRKNNIPYSVEFVDEDCDDYEEINILSLTQSKKETYDDNENYENINDILYQQYEDYWDGYMLAEYYNDTDYYG